MDSDDFGAILVLITIFLAGVLCGYIWGNNTENFTFRYEVNFKGDECQILNEKFVICKYKSLDDAETTDFEGVTINGK